ncbi:MAG: hypothetical protein ACLFPE_14540, partial [Bacteroidales bacterium]
MKKRDILFVLCVVLFFLPFFLIGRVYEFYHAFNLDHPFLMSFVKFAILSTLGEVIGLRIRTGKYNATGFGILPRAIVWGFLGVGIQMAFVIFGQGAPRMLAVMGVYFPTANPADVL